MTNPLPTPDEEKPHQTPLTPIEDEFSADDFKTIPPEQFVEQSNIEPILVTEKVESKGFQPADDLKTIAPEQLEQLLEVSENSSSSKLSDALAQEMEEIKPHEQASWVDDTERFKQNYSKDDTLLHPHSFGSKSAIQPGDSIGNYEVKAKLGEGGMGTVYKCLDPVLQRYVAIKLLKAKYSSSPTFRSRFEVEARAVAQLRHPNIIQVFQAGEDEKSKCLFFAMDFIEGQGLDEILKAQGKLAPEKALKYMEQVAQGLKYSHQKKILHRDIKLANIMISKEDQAMIADFGLAKVVGSVEEELGDENHAPIDMNLTQVGSVMGTPMYMGPERIDGINDDPRSDIYALGMVLYYCLTGEKPFPYNDVIQILEAQKREEPASITQFVPDCPPEVLRIFKKSASKELKERFQNAEELLLNIAEIRRSKEKAQEIYEKKKLSAIALSSLPQETTSSFSYLKYIVPILALIGIIGLVKILTAIDITGKTSNSNSPFLTREADLKWSQDQETRIAGTFVEVENLDEDVIVTLNTVFDGESWGEEKSIFFSTNHWKSLKEQYMFEFKEGDYLSFKGKAQLEKEAEPFLKGDLESFLSIENLKRLHRKQENTTPIRIEEFSKELEGEVVQAIGSIISIEEDDSTYTLFIADNQGGQVWVTFSRVILDKIEAQKYSPRVGDCVHAIGKLTYEEGEEIFYYVELDETRMDSLTLVK